MKLASKFALCLLPLAAGAALALFFKVMRVDLESMSPTIRRGDLVLVARINEGIGEEGGDRDSIVVALQQEKYIVKQLIAIAGDVVETRERGQVFVNSRFFPTFAAPRPTADRKRTITRVRVPAGYVFVIGDNSYKSVDSRSFGVIPVRSIKGRVLLGWRPSLSLPRAH
ncbi:signal peptidase I [Lysobacter sp. 1R34A]|uniref:signal peptidase I n=1 Tax=Lysobacter sp. 1R34A TaxID=3445786 RepID=UPI003EEAA9EA